MGIAVAVNCSHASAQAHFVGHGRAAGAMGGKWNLCTRELLELLRIDPHHNMLFIPVSKHYIPLDAFATNVGERMQWVLDNDQEAQKIAERGTLWMEDLVFHPDAAEDDRIIQEEILRRYHAHFLPMSA